MGNIRRLILDVLKLHKPPLYEISEALCVLPGVEGVSCMLEEVDQDTESIKVIIQGKHIDFDLVERTLQNKGADIHSIDGVYSGSMIVEDVETPQDK